MDKKNIVGVIAKDKYVARNFLDKLVGERLLKDLVGITVTRNRGEEYVFIDSIYKTIPLGESARGIRVDELYICDDIGSAFIESVLPFLLRGGAVVAYWFEKSDYI